MNLDYHQKTMKMASSQILDIANVSNPLYNANSIDSQNASQSLRMNDKILLENSDLKTQLKQLRKGF